MLFPHPPSSALFLSTKLLHIISWDLTVGHTVINLTEEWQTWLGLFLGTEKRKTCPCKHVTVSGSSISWTRNERGAGLPPFSTRHKSFPHISASMQALPTASVLFNYCKWVGNSLSGLLVSAAVTGKCVIRVIRDNTFESVYTCVCWGFQRDGVKYLFL